MFTAMSAHAQIGPSSRGDVTLTLECRDSGEIKFEIRNVGSTDTILRLGNVMGDGGKWRAAST
jgi:hypothetical protein